MTEVSNSNSFDWTDADDVIIPAVSAVAVYLNVDNDIVIRQNPYPWQDEDALIIIPKTHIRRLIDKLTQLAAHNTSTEVENTGDSSAASANT